MTSDSKDLFYKIFDQELKDKSAVTWPCLLTEHALNTASQGLSGKESSLPVQEMQKTWLPSLGWEDTREEKWQPTPVFLPGNPMDRGAWWATVHGVTESNMTERLSVQSTERVRKWYRLYDSIYIS